MSISNSRDTIRTGEEVTKTKTSSESKPLAPLKEFEAATREFESNIRSVSFWDEAARSRKGPINLSCYEPQVDQGEFEKKRSAVADQSLAIPRKIARNCCSRPEIVTQGPTL